MINKDILKGAPDGATHWDFNEYIRHEGNGKWSCWDNDLKRWEHSTSEIGTRSLEDVKRLVEFENALITLLEATSDLDDEYPYVAVAEGNARKVLEE